VPYEAITADTASATAGAAAAAAHPGSRLLDVTVYPIPSVLPRLAAFTRI
jgi:hypothetical protein